MKLTRLLQGLTVSFLVITSLVTAANPIAAQSNTKTYSIDALKVNIKINKDSTFNVSEEQDYTFNDYFKEMYRDVTLVNQDNVTKCHNDSSLQCGGFNYLSVDSVFVNGEKISPDKYKLRTVYINNEKRAEIAYEFANGTEVPLYNQKYSFKVNYTILGGLGFFPNYDLFYWNALFQDRDKYISSATVDITYPNAINLDKSSSRLITNNIVKVTQPNDNEVNYQTSNLAPNDNFTIVQKISNAVISKPSNLKMIANPGSQHLKINDSINIDVNNQDLISGLPAGTLKLDFSSAGYFPSSQNISLEPGETKNVTSNLEITPELQATLVIIGILNVVCLSLLPIILGLIYLLWRLKGRDKGITTIIPQYSPPANMPPYLLGALINEGVDNIDITATIIDLAYRGYIKIIEKDAHWGRKDYTLEKVKDLLIGLNPTEIEIVSVLFAAGDIVSLDSLKYKLYLSMPKIQKDINQQLVTLGYYKTNPSFTKTIWFVIGILGLIIGGGIGFLLALLNIFTGLITGIATGIALLIVGRFMPAKTELGGKTYSEILGFKMYLETAEKYRLQNLTPAEFEKYLSYAIAFGIEQQWAEKFKDIYTSAPEWFVGNYSTFNTIIFVSSLRNFTTNSTTTFTARPSSNNTFGGGGFGSSGGGFGGGFGGGGGGGGGGGAR